MKYLLGLKKLPFEQCVDQIIYVEGEYDEKVNRYIQENYELITQKFESWGYKFCYMPYLGQELAESKSMQYYVPFASSNFKPISEFKSDFLLNWMVNPSNKKKIKPSLLYYHPYCFKSDYIGAESQYRGITLSLEYERTNDLSNVLHEIHIDLCNYADQVPRFHFVPNEMVEQFKSDLTEEERKEIEIWEEIAEKFRRKGVERYLLATMAYGEDEKLSPLQVTKDYRIILTDTGEEVKMGELPKSLYLLYLRREKGIDFSHLIDYADELRVIYMKLLGAKIITDDINDSINRLVNCSYNNSIHEKRTYIKKAFLRFMNDHVASNYYLSGDSKNGEKFIKISRELVKIECDLGPITEPKDRIIYKLD